MPGKVIKFDKATLAELTSLASDTMMDFQELAEEAFRDLLKKTQPAGGFERRIAQERQSSIGIC